MSDSPTSSAGHRPLRDRLLPSWIFCYFAGGRASSSAPVASSAIASSTTAAGDELDGPQPHLRSPASTVATSPSTSPSPGKRPGLRERVSISHLYRRLSRALSPSSRGSSHIPCLPEPGPASDALQAPPSPGPSTDGASPNPPTGSLIPPPALEVIASSTDVSHAPINTSSASVDVPDVSTADPLTEMWNEAVVEWQRKTGLDLTAPDAVPLDSKEALVMFIAKMEGEVQGLLSTGRWSCIRDKFISFARILEKLCIPIGEGLGSTATIRAHEELLRITDVFDEIMMHLKVVEIVAALPGTLLHDTSVELLIQIIAVLGVVIEVVREKFAERRFYLFKAKLPAGCGKSTLMNFCCTSVVIDTIKANTDICTAVDHEFGEGGLLAGNSDTDALRKRLMQGANGK
ncbi:uncharacterized protein SCHCODRAFT_02669152 [Schizophyllum commune H4-8]|uniref:Fungal STAND N-terminal Goodbye domain-containing protein n=1 Tax=Schizophyllum commune (strain H4-8 / FGSC 9210) TaxID=578458 RepID=D8QAP1_SCHCM|nr:uncharacterized protein SCHCODRAFT_02669152 [Schizophyllum commune H4-8]KAI5889883.1 hypothetical protein SCHCODRAFT_02669152 [Schizophyllum commune H4-8]